MTFHARFVIQSYVQLDNIRMLQENERRFMNSAELCAGASVIRKVGFRGETNRGICPGSLSREGRGSAKLSNNSGIIEGSEL